MLEKWKKAFAANLVLLLPARTAEMFPSILFNFQMIKFLGIKIEKVWEWESVGREQLKVFRIHLNLLWVCKGKQLCQEGTLLRRMLDKHGGFICWKERVHIWVITFKIWVIFQYMPALDKGVIP